MTKGLWNNVKAGAHDVGRIGRREYHRHEGDLGRAVGTRRKRGSRGSKSGWVKGHYAYRRGRKVWVARHRRG